MVKLLVIIFMILLIFLSLGGYLFLSEKIIEGQKQIVKGQLLINEGQVTFDAGKVELEEGRQESLDGKREYEEAEDNLFMVFADKLFNGGRGYKAGRRRIAEGDKQIALGVDNINDGERRLNAGKRELLKGIEQVELAKGARIACMLGGVFFSLVTLMLAVCWRRSLIRVFLDPVKKQSI